MPLDVQKLLDRIEALEQGLKELLQRVVELEEEVRRQRHTSYQAQNTTINWWQTWKQDGDS